MKKLVITFFIILLICSKIFAQTEQGNIQLFNRSISETVFVTVNVDKLDIKTALNLGARAFVFTNKNTNTELNRCFPVISHFLTNHPKALISVLILHPTDSSFLRMTLRKNKLEQFVYHEAISTGWPSLTALVNQNKRLIIFTKNACKPAYLLDDNVSINTFAQIQLQKTSILKKNANTLFCYNPEIELFTNKHDTIHLFRAFYPWKRKGTVPNFLISSASLVAQSVKVADSLNKTPRFSGKIFFKNKISDNTYLTNGQNTTFNGSFNFPRVNKFWELFIPWKEGYKFYPEVSKFDNMHSYQEFIATKLSLEDDLLYQNSFDNGSKNDVDNNNSREEIFLVKFKAEKKRGDVAVFNTPNAAIQLEKNTNLSTEKPFSISVWVKPYRVNGIHTILSKAEIFSVKIRYDHLSFAGTGFQSKISTTKKIEPNVWQHLTYVCIPNYHVQFFVNGHLIYEDEMNKLLSNDKSITIGNNFSNEGYWGEMDELRVWNRALSKEEVADLYTNNSRSNSTIWMYWIVTILSLIGTLLFIVRTKKNKKIVATVVSPAEWKQKSKQNIFLFGGLSVHNNFGDELTTQFAPKVKQLFLLLLLQPKGLSISQINEELWPGTEEEKAKQNRNYIIQQLKRNLADIKFVTLEYQTKIWALKIEDDVFIDIEEHKKLVRLINSNMHESQNLADAYVSLIERGKFLQGIDMEAFDPYKSKVADQIIESVLLFSNHADNKMSLRLGNALLLHDCLNEDGLRLSLSSLVKMGRNGEAHTLYDSFCKKYKTSYDENFPTEFSVFLKI